MPFESEIHQTIRKLIIRKVPVSGAIVTAEGERIRDVAGYMLSEKQLLYLNSHNKLTAWDIREFAERFAAVQRP